MKKKNENKQVHVVEPYQKSELLHLNRSERKYTQSTGLHSNVSASGSNVVQRGPLLCGTVWYSMVCHHMQARFCYVCSPRSHAGCEIRTCTRDLPAICIGRTCNCMRISNNCSTFNIPIGQIYTYSKQLRYSYPL